MAVMVWGQASTGKAIGGYAISGKGRSAELMKSVGKQGILALTGLADCEMAVGSFHPALTLGLS